MGTLKAAHFQYCRIRLDSLANWLAAFDVWPDVLERLAIANVTDSSFRDAIKPGSQIIACPAEQNLRNLPIRKLPQTSSHDLQTVVQ